MQKPNVQKVRLTCAQLGRAAGSRFVEALEQRQLMSANLIVNGDFSRGMSGFASSYFKGGTSLVPTDTYAVGTNPHTYHPAGASFGDHTTGFGKMLMVNGSPTAGGVIWREAIKVVPGVAYVFNGFAASWAMTGLVDSDESPAQVQVAINGKVISTNALPATSGQWSALTGSWLATAGRAVITITDLNIDVGGNDSAYDDFSFTALASIRGSVVSAFINAKGNVGARHKPIAGVTLFLDSNGNGQLDESEVTALSNKAGAYVFTGLAGGTYTVCQMNPPTSDLPPAQLNVHVVAGKQVAHVNLLDIYTAAVPTARIFK